MHFLRDCGCTKEVVKQSKPRQSNNNSDIAASYRGFEKSWQRSCSWQRWFLCTKTLRCAHILLGKEIFYEEVKEVSEFNFKPTMKLKLLSLTASDAIICTPANISSKYANLKSSKLCSEEVKRGDPVVFISVLYQGITFTLKLSLNSRSNIRLVLFSVFDSLLR